MVLAVAAVAAVVPLAACGVEAGDDLEGAAGRSLLDAGQAEQDRDEAIDDAGEALLEQGEALGLEGELSADENACIVEAASAAGLEVRSLLGDVDADDDRAAFIEIVLGCVDSPADHPLLVSSLGGTLRSALPGTDLSDEEVACFLQHVLDESPDPARTLAVGDLEGDIERFRDAAASCLTEENLAIVDGAEGAGPQTYGDDERLDGMQDDCEDGDDRACDLLYLSSSVGSDYEEVAASCGGRVPPGDSFCSAEAVTDDTGYSPLDNPGLAVLIDDCRAGDFTACDLLFRIAPPGSDAERIGDSCGGRIISALPDCRTRFG